MQPTCGGAENVVKNRNPANIRKWIARSFITLGIYTPPARVLLNIRWVTHRYGQLYLHCFHFWVPSSCFCIVISLLWGWNNPVQRCLPVGGRLHYPRRRRWWLRTDHRLLLMCNQTTTSGNIITQSIIFSLALKQLFVYFASSAATSRQNFFNLHVSNCRVRQLQFSGIFVALGFVGNGVNAILTAHDRQTMMQITRAEIIAVTLLIHQSLWPFRPLLCTCNQAVSLMLELTITSARQWSPDIAVSNGRLPDGYHHDQS